MFKSRSFHFSPNARSFYCLFCFSVWFSAVFLKPAPKVRLSRLWLLACSQTAVCNWSSFHCTHTDSSTHTEISWRSTMTVSCLLYTHPHKRDSIEGRFGYYNTRVICVCVCACVFADTVLSLFDESADDDKYLTDSSAKILEIKPTCMAVSYSR